MPLKSEPFTRVTQGCLVVHAEMTVAFPLCFKMTGAMSNHHYCGFTRTPVNHCSIFFFFAPKICIEGRGKAQGDHPWKIFLKLFLKSENKSQRFFFFPLLIEYRLDFLIKTHTHTHTHSHTLNSLWACRMPTR